MIKQKLQEQQLAALKAKDAKKLTLIRYILAQIQNKEIEKKGSLTDEETTAVVQKIAKQLKESIEAAKKAGRNDLVGQYQGQLAVLKKI
jgi:uncharacterized protein YqeY